jgi:hypothetical protein
LAARRGQRGALASAAQDDLGIDERKRHDPGSAAASSGPLYDPLRHLLLLRLERELRTGALRRVMRASTCQS